MEADSENKRGRGRPRKIDKMFIRSGEVRRTCENKYYVMKALQAMKISMWDDSNLDECDRRIRDFYAPSGHIRRNSILEKIGRALEAHRIQDETEAKFVAMVALTCYRDGMTVKEILGKFDDICEALAYTRLKRYEEARRRWEAAHLL